MLEVLGWKQRAGTTSSIFGTVGPRVMLAFDELFGRRMPAETPALPGKRQAGEKLRRSLFDGSARPGVRYNPANSV